MGSAYTSIDKYLFFFTYSLFFSVDLNKHLKGFCFGGVFFSWILSSKDSSTSLLIIWEPAMIGVYIGILLSSSLIEPALSPIFLSLIALLRKLSTLWSKSSVFLRLLV